jgi:hypothetical protein
VSYFTLERKFQEPPAQKPSLMAGPLLEFQRY